MAGIFCQYIQPKKDDEKNGFIFYFIGYVIIMFYFAFWLL